MNLTKREELIICFVKELLPTLGTLQYPIGGTMNIASHVTIRDIVEKAVDLTDELLDQIGEKKELI